MAFALVEGEDEDGEEEEAMKEEKMRKVMAIPLWRYPQAGRVAAWVRLRGRCGPSLRVPHPLTCTYHPSSAPPPAPRSVSTSNGVSAHMRRAAFSILSCRAMSDRKGRGGLEAEETP